MDQRPIPDSAMPEDLEAARDALGNGQAGYYFLSGGGAFSTPFSRVVGAAVSTPNTMGISRPEQVKPEWIAPELHVYVPSLDELGLVRWPIAVFITPVEAEDPLKVIYPIRTDPMPTVLRDFMGWTDKGPGVTAVFPLAVLSEGRAVHTVYDGLAYERGRHVSQFDLQRVR